MGNPGPLCDHGQVGKGRRPRPPVWVGVGVVVLLASVALRPEHPPGRNAPASGQPTYPVLAEAEAERTAASQNFSVTWVHDPASPDAPNLRDKDKNGVPDSVAPLLPAFEAARAFLLGELGYKAPPLNGPYRLYVAGRPGRAETKLAPGGDARSKPSFTIIPTADLSGPAATSRQLRVLAVHEYFHAIQNGYDADYDHWIGEASSTWAQDAFDDALDSNHKVLGSFVPSPRRSLTDIDGEREYGAFLFIQFLVERYGGGEPGIVREVWEHMAGTDAIGALEEVLQARGVSSTTAWSEFLLWRWDLERFQEGRAYQQQLGNAWPKPLQLTEVRAESCRLSSDAGVGLPPLSGDYSVFRPADRPDRGRATVTVEGPPGASAFVLVEKPSGKEKAQLLEVGADGLASARVRFGDDVVKRVVLGVGNPATSGLPAHFGYSLRVDGRAATAATAIDPPADTNYFGGLGLRGRVTCDGQPAPLANLVLVQDMHSGEQRTFPLNTGLDGSWSINIQPEQSSTYHLELVDPLLTPTVSELWGVAVRVGLTLAQPAADVPLGTPVEVQGTLTPPHPGALVLIEYRRPDLSWRPGPQTDVAPDGTFRTSLTLPSSGVWGLRATVLDTGDQDHIGATTVNDVFVNIR